MKIRHAFMTVQRGLARYYDEAWAKHLLAGLAVGSCPRCRASRAFIGAVIVTGLVEDRAALLVQLVQPSMVDTIRRIGLDPAWLYQEVAATARVYPIDPPDLLAWVKRQIEEMVEDRRRQKEYPTPFAASEWVGEAENYGPADHVRRGANRRRH